ncbi:hypothetical protein ACMFMG_006911 [Clarireedia jacksonii]
MSSLINSTLALANATMRAVVWQGTPYHMAVLDVPRPIIQAGTDAIVRVTTAAICGTDLHTYHWVYGSAEAPWIMGHEGIGIVEEIGSAVSGISVGDHVVIPDSVVIETTDGSAASPLSYGLGEDYGEGMGGTQAEYVRVPYAANALIPIPSTNTTNGTAIPDSVYLTIGDIFSTAWVGVTRSGFQPGDTIAIFGAGPVGLLAAHSAILRGASRVYSIDHEPTRLSLAESIGAIPINFATVDPVSFIPSQSPSGVHRAVDCVGRPSRSSPPMAVSAASASTTRKANSSGTPLAAEYTPDLEFPAAEFFTKGLSWVTRPVDIYETVPELLQLVASGVARLGFVVSAVVGIEDAPGCHGRFDRHEEVKVYISFP